MGARDESTKKTHDLGSGALGVVVFAGAVPFGALLEEGRPLELGRDADVAIEHASVSRRHARIEWSGSTPFVRDLGSTNGTRVDGRRLAPEERAAIGVGSALVLGDVPVVVQRAPAVRDVLTGRGEPAGLPAGVIAADPHSRDLYALVQMVAPSDLPILILGETGSGKEVVARAVHAASARASRPFLAVSCAALPQSLLESELFGHERGAFTGAVGAKPGLFEAADGGTIFLDEIGELQLATQATLLRVLESGEVMRLGSRRPKHVDVRIVSATHRDIEARAQQEAFRPDLYYRIAGMVVRVPPLRERPADIRPLAEQFVAQVAAKTKRPPPTLSARVIAILEAHAWPGNARELRNTMQRAAALAGAAPTIEPAHLGLGVAPGASSGPPPAARDLRGAVDRFERERIVQALKEAGGNQTRAASLLGIARRTLVAKIEQHGIDRPRKRGP